MAWDLGIVGLLYLGGMSLVFGLLAQLLAWRAGPKWLWALVAACSFGVGLFVSEVWFGWATEEDLQPNIDGLSFDEVLLIGLVPVIATILVARYLAPRSRGTPSHHHAG